MGELPDERFYSISLLSISVGMAMSLITSAPTDVPEGNEKRPKTLGAKA
jgi:hypothetical protein